MSGVVECPVSAAARATPLAEALVHAGASLDYAALDAAVRRMSSALRKHGLAAGQRLAVLANNGPGMVALIHAAGRDRLPLVLLNARLTAAEIAAQIAVARPALVVADSALRGRVTGPALALEELVGEASRAAPWTGPATLDPAVPHTVLFTSGTEGTPKAAVLSAGAHLASARASNALLSFGRASRYLCTLPLFHVGGLSVVFRCALAGATLLLEERFDAQTAAAALGSGATHASLVAATLARTLDARGTEPFPDSVRAVLIGGGPTPEALLARAARAGLPVLQTYGLTEAASQVCTERPGEADGKTSGRPLPCTEVRVVDADGRPVPSLADGEIEVRGPTLFTGYVADPQATGAALRGGWLRTRDLGTLDERGRLTVHARRSDLILSGGENVYPAEVEAVLLSHPDVGEAAVLGRPHPDWGQVVVAILSPRAGSTFSPAALEAHCRARLASFKVPRAFHRIAELPRTAAGKVDRQALASTFI
ncbi:MAG: o-succinylbenzoate--CoA ligase [Myxococcales bacterium]